MAVSLVILSGCGMREVANRPAEEVLRERIAAYWDLRVKGDVVKAYDFEAPIYRKRVPIGTYVRTYSNPVISYRAYEIADMKLVEQDRADASVKVTQTLKLPGTKPLTTEMLLIDRWVNIDGDWYHVVDAARERLTHEK